MANILVSFFSGLGEDRFVSFYEGFMESLKENGNSVKYIITNNFLEVGWNGENFLKEDVKKSELIKCVHDFNPDVCFTFNNSIPQDIVENIECPIIIWHADTYQYFNGKKYLKENPRRFHYVCPFQSDVDTIKTELKVKDDLILKIIPATSLKNPSGDIENNISFIGSMFFMQNFKDIAKKVKDQETLLMVAKQLNANPGLNYSRLLEENNCSELEQYITKSDILGLYSIQNRNQTLSMLFDLGLKIYGKGEYFSWRDIGDYLPFLGLCYDDRDVFSLQHNQDIYNSTKVSINISHAQSREGFSWRVFDIMASNSCLISDRSDGLASFTKGYVEVPTYDSPYEARILCKKLLNDDIWRKEIVAGSQKCIEEKGRWHHRFQDIYEMTGINLLNDKIVNNEISMIHSSDFLPTEKELAAKRKEVKVKDAEAKATALAEAKRRPLLHKVLLRIMRKLGYI